MQEIKLNGESMNIVDDNIEKLKTIFPDVFTEGKVDFDKLQSVLGNYIETNDERYNFTWAGKQNALRLAQTPSTGTLRPCKDENESKNWDTTQNLYIEGDNLEVLKLLQKSYHNKIKMIYIDPPYNTGSDFVYKDNFSDSIENYKKITGQIDEEGNKISTNSESDGRYHTNWLNMMYPRLRLARNLLKEDGVIFISIDDNEVENLKKICNEIFGDDNFIGCAGRISKKASNQGAFWCNNFDYLLTYTKNKEACSPFFGGINYKAYNLTETEGEKKDELYQLIRLYMTSLDPLRGCTNQRYYIECPDGTFVIPPGENYPRELKDGAGVPPQTSKDKVWRWSLNTYLENKDKIVVKKVSSSNLVDQNGNPAKWNVFTKTYLTDVISKSTAKPNNFIEDHINQSASHELNALEIPFDYAKPSSLIKFLAETCCVDKDDIIMDFFSGSATTADACMQLNKQDNGNRKCISVQLPQPLSPDCKDEKESCIFLTKLNKPLYLTEIGKERIRRAGDKIKQEIEDGNKQLKIGEEPKKVPDIGFKVFKLDTSNIKKWNGNADTIESEIQGSIFNYEVGRSELDVVYEIMLKCGLDLTYPIEEINVNGKTLYSIGAGAMFVCMDDKITQDIADKIVEIKDEHDIVEPVTVFKDNGFTTDSNKTNIKETLRVAGIKDFITV